LVYSGTSLSTASTVIEGLRWLTVIGVGLLVTFVFAKITTCDGDPISSEGMHEGWVGYNHTTAASYDERG